MPTDNKNPWQFLSALDGSRDLDREILRRTRPAELDLVTHMVMSARTSILYAASGNGKTSLINAGLIPFFLQLGYVVFRTRPRPPWSVDDPCDAFKECMKREFWLPESLPAPELALSAVKSELSSLGVSEKSALSLLVNELENHLLRFSQSPEEHSADLMAFMRSRAPDASLATFLGQVQAFLGGKCRILIVCDQFEELFVHYSGTEKLARFVREIGDAFKSDCSIQFLFSMREDWVGSMIEFRPVIPDIFTAYFKLLPLNRKAAVPALKLPLESFGLSIEDSLAEQILLDLARCFSSANREQGHDDRSRAESEPAYLELPALQIVAESLWQTRYRVKNPFTQEHYDFLASMNNPESTPSASGSLAP